MSQKVLTDRQRQIKTRLDQGMTAREIAEDLGITRNAVYQQIQSLRKHGFLAPDFTPTGLPMREQPGSGVLSRLLKDDNGDSAEHVEAAGARALVLELQRTRDELHAIARRISSIVG